MPVSNSNNINNIITKRAQLTQLSNNLVYREDHFDHNSLDVDTHIDVIGKNETSKVVPVAPVSDIDKPQTQQKQEVTADSFTGTTTGTINNDVSVSVGCARELIEQGVFKKLLLDVRTTELPYPFDRRA